MRGVIFVGLSALIVAQTAEARTYGGKAEIGNKTCNGQFRYDTENGLGGTIISQQCAADLGLGTLAGGVLTTPNGTASAGANGVYTFWCFPNVTITLTDSNGNACPVKQTVYAAKDQTGGNPALAGLNIVNQDWINDAKACQSGAGAQAKGYWNPGWTPPAPPQQKPVAPQVNPAPARPVESYKPGWGKPGQIFQINTVYEADSQFSYLPQSYISQLGLTPVGSPIFLPSADPAGYAALNFGWFLNDGQVSFQAYQLPIFDTGIGPIQTGLVLAIDDANSSFAISGGNFLTDYLYGATDGQGSFIVGYVPAPGSMALLGIAGMFMGRRRR